MSWLKDNLIALLVVALLAALAFGGWNLWRKNVYYDALNIAAAKRAGDVREAENVLKATITGLERELATRRNARAPDIQQQLEDAGRPPAERIVYRLRDRWLPVACPAGAGPDDRDEAVGGLQRADEEFLVRESVRADEVVDQLNACIDAYDAARETALKANR